MDNTPTNSLHIQSKRLSNVVIPRLSLHRPSFRRSSTGGDRAGSNEKFDDRNFASRSSFLFSF